MTKEQFLKSAEETHGEKYDYSKVEYVNGATKVSIICPIHGVFEQRPFDHIREQGCPKCGHEKSSGEKKKGREKFIQESKAVHGEKYDYSKVEYVNSLTKVSIICPVHGIFSQRPSEHLRGQGCPECGKEKCAKSRTCSKDSFISKAKIIHGDKYDYSGSEYKDRRTKVKIICRSCGRAFYMAPYSHLAGEGCICFSSSKSSQEKELVKYIKSIYKGDVIENDRKILHGKELDVYIPEKKIAFEYDGCHWHNNVNNYFKYEECAKKGIRLYHIAESDWLSDNESVKEIIAHIFGAYTKVDSSLCSISEMSAQEYEGFCSKNGISKGHMEKDVMIGMRLDGTVICALRFSQRGRGWALKGVHKAKGVEVDAKSAVSYFEEKHRPAGIWMEVQKDFFDKSYAENLGFIFKEETKPGFKYFKENHSDRNYSTIEDDEKSWDEMKAMGYGRIFDYGKFIFIKEESWEEKR